MDIYRDIDIIACVRSTENVALTCVEIFDIDTIACVRSTANRQPITEGQMKIKPRPALYVLIPYLLGIIVGRWASIPFLWLWLSILFSFIGSIVTRNRSRYLCYGMLHLAVFAGGMLRLETASHSPIPVHFYDEPVSFSGVTAYQPERGKEWDACYAVGELQLLSDPSHRVTANFSSDFKSWCHFATVNT